MANSPINIGAQLVCYGYINNSSWSISSTTLISFGTSATPIGSNVAVIENDKLGTLDLTQTDKAQFTINNLPSGTYEVGFIAMGYIPGTTSYAAAAVFDGSTLSVPVPFYASGTQESPFPVTAFFKYQESGNRTFELYGATNSGSFLLDNTNTTSKFPFWIKRIA